MAGPSNVMRMEAVSKGSQERAKKRKEILNYEGKEKLDYEIGMYKSRIHNCENDLKKFPDNPGIESKIKRMKQDMKRRQVELLKMEEETGPTESSKEVVNPDGLRQTKLDEFEGEDDEENKDEEE